MNSKVLNVGKKDYQEEFKGKIIKIPAGGHIVMEFYDACAFKGTYPGKGIVKQIKVEKIPGTDKSPDLKVCNMCSSTFATEKELLEHSKIHSDSVAPEITEKKKAGRPTNEELRRRREMKNDTGTSAGNNKGAN